MNDRIEAVAESWASIDGKNEAFQRERDNDIDYKDPTYTGHYAGYVVEASELIKRIESRGFTISRK